MTNETHSEYAMRSRISRSSSDQERRRDVLSCRDTVIVERKVKAGDTLNKIAIQYSVNISDIKRVNNLVKDQDFVALTVVKIPISRMRYALGTGSFSSDDEHIIDFDQRSCLLSEERSSRDPSVEEIFNKTDAAIAQVRETLPEDGIPGSFHFVDARPPDSVCSIWGLLIGVIVIFMVIPLLLTFYEETEKDSEK
uniref:LysM domain-containing protein n=1 Tax=Angiostrongylus cantonensis TaxID=6313 RepID=A0A0K0CXQ9_ANGCA